VSGVIGNVVLSSPGATWDEYVSEGRALATFYADLLGMTIIREDWFKIAKDPDGAPQLAFGDGPGPYVPPTWPEQERPQQLHLDIAVPDLDAGDAFVTGRGAERLKDSGAFRVYRDPVGHPFCLYASDVTEPSLARIVYDCFSPRALASFYAELLEMHTTVSDDVDRVVIAKDEGTFPMLAFQHAEFVAPRWPDPAYPQQVHLDLYFEESLPAQRRALGLGARRLEAKGGSCPVFADPAGHPFCLCAPGE
jgi:catechol 2,3-dioxygenase-like lactoylglutathione lyase family enzyme